MNRMSTMELQRGGEGTIASKPRQPFRAPSTDDKAMLKAAADLTRGVPMKRLAEIYEIVTVILLACDPGNTFMTGQTLGADGGITAV